jgi:adenylate kinase
LIILTGVAGSGKSMQGRLFADESGYAWISTGELLRVLVTGQRRHEMLEGKLLSDDEMITILDKVFELIDPKKEFVLDGFPRTIPQCDWLLGEVHSGRIKLTTVINLSATEEVVRERLRGRGRIDDTEEAIERRFEEYRQTTLPILEHLRSEDVPVHDIDADQSPQAVHDAILAVVGMQES